MLKSETTIAAGPYLLRDFCRGGVNFSGEGAVWILQEDRNRIVILVRYD